MNDTPIDQTKRERALDQLAAESQKMGLYDDAPKYDLDVTVGDGQYRVIAHADMSGFRALRYGEEWRSLTGDNLVLALAMEVAKLREVGNALATQLQHVEELRRTDCGPVPATLTESVLKDWRNVYPTP